VASTAVTLLANASTLASASGGPYRPPNWSTGPAMISITVPANNSGATNNSLSLSSTVPDDGSSGLFTATPSPVAAPPTTYVFDAVLDLEHEQRLEQTHHPIQTGADVSSHAYLMPASVVMNVLMSDAVDAYTPGSFTGNPSKSVSAYLTMLNIQATRAPLTITTRLRTYTNMLIAGISPREDYRTITGLRMRVEFHQILTASTSTAPASARPDDTNSTGLGAVSTTPVAPAATTTPAGVSTSATPTASSANSNLINQFGFPSQAAASPYTLPTNDMFTDFTTVVNTPGAAPISSSPGQQTLPGLPNALAL
jgi:hypothetical protein